MGCRDMTRRRVKGEIENDRDRARRRVKGGGLRENKTGRKKEGKTVTLESQPTLRLSTSRFSYTFASMKVEMLLRSYHPNHQRRLRLDFPLF